MNRKEAKELMPIIQAFAEGKTIQYYDSLIDIADWEDCENPNFENLTYKFRIKPETTYRQFKDAEECWQEMLKHKPFGWVKSTLFKDFALVKRVTTLYVEINRDIIDYKDALEKFTFADDTNFGVKVE